MNEFNQKDKGNKKDAQVKTFPVQFAFKEIQENFNINNNSLSKFSKEGIINQAINFHKKGNILEAKKYYKYFIDKGFIDYRVFSNYGTILKDLGKLEEAKLSLQKAIELKPDFAIGHSNLGNILKHLGKLEEAELSLRKAIELKPHSADSHSNLGSTLKCLGKLEEAELSLRKAIELKPDFATAYSNLGNVLKDLGKLEEAELSLRKAIELKPDFATAYSNLGSILNDLGKLEEAELSLHKAIKLKPDFATAYFNLSTIQLLKGNYQSGLENYEFRFQTDAPPITHGNTKLQRVDQKKLQKEEKLLVISEQGLGDTLQYMRYIPYLRNQGFDISFSAHKKLHTLIKSSGIDSNPLTPEEAWKVSQGKFIPLLSLAKYLKVGPNNPIISDPYIFSTDELKKKWKQNLSKEKKPIVAINWQGNPNMEKVKYQGRSIPLELFSILFDRNEITLLSLQKGFGSEQLDNCSFKKKFVACQPEIDSCWDFLENAAIIESCDLIITCDTSIAHLAGGMGKKVWLLLRDIPFWTWGIEGEVTFWYKSMRLFRQKERHDWNEVMIRVSGALKEEMKR